MSKRARRILVTAIVALFAALIVWPVFYGKTRPPPQQAQNQAQTQPQAQDANQAQTAPDAAAGEGEPAPAATAPADGEAPATAPQTTQPSIDAAVRFAGLRAVAAGGDLGNSRDQPVSSLGSIDPRRAALHVELSRFGAGIQRIAFSDIWQHARAKRQARAYFETLAPDQPIDPSQLPEDDRYVLVQRSPFKTYDQNSDTWFYNQTPVMAARALIINSATVFLISDEAWSETAPGEFRSRIVNEAGEAIALITRRYALGPDYDISLDQTITNLTDQPLEIRWQQFGPVDLEHERSGYIERRRVHFGYLPDPQGRPQFVLADDSMTMERSSAVKQYTRAAQSGNPQARLLWPNDDSRAYGYDLSWFAVTNRYFGLAAHPAVRNGLPVTASFRNTVESVEIGVSNVGAPDETLYSILHSPAVRLAPGEEHALNMAVFAGPLDPDLLHQQPYAALYMHGMILYSMSGCCTFLTFQWLAHLLLWFLSFLHDYILLDWGMAIIGLVCVVRILLHPLTKKSQINMQRFGKQMQALKPEIDKLQKKYSSDPKRMQQEQLRLMREHGVNPLQVLGCLPMFLQMPIWIALWAMLYLAWDIRHQAAFYGLFQLFANWDFMGDLSSPDGFIGLGAGFTLPLFGHIGSINLLPLLMGAVFWIQQKYMSPPPSPNMTPEQIQQQKIMKWMLVLMMPLIMYKAPSGLTLYIMTSSIIGILESRYVRRHIDQLDLAPKPGAGGGALAAKAKKPKDSLGRAWAERLEALRQRQAQRQQERRSFKKRK